MEFINAIKAFFLSNLGSITWKKVKDFIVEQLKGAAFKAALLKFFGTTAGLGFKGWLVKQILENFFDDIGEPVIRGALNQAGYIYDKVDGKKKIDNIRKAKAENDSGAYDSTVDDILS